MCISDRNSDRYILRLLLPSVFFYTGNFSHQNSVQNAYQNSNQNIYRNSGRKADDFSYRILQIEKQAQAFFVPRSTCAFGPTLRQTRSRKRFNHLADWVSKRIIYASNQAHPGFLWKTGTSHGLNQGVYSSPYKPQVTYCWERLLRIKSRDIQRSDLTGSKSAYLIQNIY